LVPGCHAAGGGAPVGSGLSASSGAGRGQLQGLQRQPFVL
jgi:hypothetical protein